MNSQKYLKPFVPPIVWSALRRIASSKQDNLPAPAQDFSTVVSANQFCVSFSRVDSSAGTFFVPRFAEHRPASQAILDGRFYEPKTHALISAILQLRPGSLVHAGTFFGDMLPSFSKACPRTVFAFEPVLENYVLAKLCIQENRLTNVVMQNAGLGSSISVARVDTEAENGMHRGGGSQIADRGQFTALVTIDSFNIADLSIVQLDVEGYELEALRGAAKTINRSNPIIMIEDNNRNCEQFLTSVEYSYIGEIPGLMIWQSRYDGSDVRGVLSRL